MLTIYPSNRLEVLSQLLQAVLNYRESSIFTADQILVESRGMQHWLNMQMALQQGVAMNMEFPMPSRFIWSLARQILGNDKVPQQSTYRREVMSWRIDRLLSSNALLENGDCEPLKSYWISSEGSSDELKRFQLATKIADLFEQYLIYRPEWLFAWEEGRLCAGKAEETAFSVEVEKWQAAIWNKLVEEEPLHPARLQQKALKALPEHVDKLPKQLSIFAINALAPQMLNFFSAISEHTQVHLFHLNPCVDFWGELQSDKAIARKHRERQFKQWLHPQNSNPLLANLGQQGKDLFNALQEMGNNEISAFNSDPVTLSQEGHVTLLGKLQQDILQLKDARQNTVTINPDDSILISSCHSALREIQSLHDELLRQFKQDPSLMPDDVLVMCPRIEDYAPYIDAVFKRPWEQCDDEGCPRLPCSIADRTLLDSEPLVHAFLELLNLPDSRFEVSRILDHLRLPAIQRKFGMTESELKTVEWWLSEAAIHWGLNGLHQQQISELPETRVVYSWEWGLSRLLKGYIYGDQSVVVENELWLPHVEGQQAILLGKFMQLLEKLQLHARLLVEKRTPDQWQVYLLGLLDELFETHSNDTDAAELIRNVVNGLSDHCQSAAYGDNVALRVVRHYLEHHFSQPDSANHFMTGQVTFCSMVPMRSIPFKVVAILGLNDGVYPRQSQPLSFDLMAHTQRKQGDRSRRGDDRYLFLEALISARQMLYLSYQGRDAKDNSERQPSLLLSELIDYLERGYGCQFDDSENSILRQKPLHPFSSEEFKGDLRSFDNGWLRLALADQNEKSGVENHQLNLAPLPKAEIATEAELSINQLIRFFNNPLREFAQGRLKLFLDIDSFELNDNEPFAFNNLDRYQVTQSIVEALEDKQSVQDLIRRTILSGHLPDTPQISDSLDSWKGRAERLHGAATNMFIAPATSHRLDLDGRSISADLRWIDNSEGIIVIHAGSANPAQHMRLWLHHLVAVVYANRPLTSIGLYLESKQDKVKQILFDSDISVQFATENLRTLISYFDEGLCKPCLLHSTLGHAVWSEGLELSAEEKMTEEEVQKKWWQVMRTQPFDPVPGLESEPYFKWFWPQIPDPKIINIKQLHEIYQPLYRCMKEQYTEQGEGQ